MEEQATVAQLGICCSGIDMAKFWTWLDPMEMKLSGISKR